MARRFGLGAAAILAVLSTVACGGTTIRGIRAEPQRYEHRDVTLKGRVVTSASVLGHGGYQLDDGTGRIWVVSEHGVPRRGEDVKTTGRVRDVVDLGNVLRADDVLAAVGDGFVLVERDHRAR
jgi:hypothetical protein